MARDIVALPPPHVREALRRLEPALALAHAAHRDEAAQRVGEPVADLLEQALLLLRPGARPRALVQTEEIRPIAFRVQRHEHLRVHGEAIGDLRLYGALVSGAGGQGAAGSERGARHFRRVRRHGHVAPFGESTRELRPRMLHHDAPGRGVRVARIDEPRAIARENVEHHLQHVSHHPLEVARFPAWRG